MDVFKTNKDLIYFLDNERLKRKKIGFVPTMGALHSGHLSLIREALANNDICVCSIFVNPVQFNNPEDLARYPRQVDEDLDKLEVEGCQAVYLPDVLELFDDPARLRTTLAFGEIENILEGKFRPGHFRGVGLVVIKLFNIVQPDNAYFGQKDLQQFCLVRQLIHDLSFNISLHRVPTKREQDGLALSSRNQRIRPEHRPVAGKFYECLQECARMLAGDLKPAGLFSFASDYLSVYEPLKLEYISLVNADTFTVLEDDRDEGNKALCIAGYVGNIRIIDNVFIN